MPSLFTPAHLHLAFNHVPIIGLTVASLPVLIGILFYSRGALASGLIAVILCVAMTPVIMETGEAARAAFFDGSAQPDLDKPGYDALRTHASRAATTAPFLYSAGILAFVALLALARFPRQAAWIGWAVLVADLLAVALSVWTAEAGGWVRHEEFRTSPVAPLSSVPLRIPQPSLPPEPSAPSAPETNAAGTP